MLAACTEEIETYSGESGIYFAMSATKGGLDDSKQDYTAETQIPFAVYSTISDTTLMVRAKVIGPAVGHDRKVTVQVVLPRMPSRPRKAGTTTRWTTAIPSRLARSMCSSPYTST